MVPQLGAKGSLDQRLLERHRGILNSGGTHRAADELVDQLFWNGRKVTLGLLGRFFFLAGINAPLRHVMPERKIYDTPTFFSQSSCPSMCLSPKLDHSEVELIAISN